jgi:hypothetical protein
MRTHTRRRRHTRPGVQHLWGFDNGHLASVVPDTDQTCLWELTLLDGNGRTRYFAAGLPVVNGALKPIDVRRLLRQIEALR